MKRIFLITLLMNLLCIANSDFLHARNEDDFEDRYSDDYEDYDYRQFQISKKKKSRRKAPPYHSQFLQLGIRIPLGFSVYKKTETDLSFLDFNQLLFVSGVGLEIDLIPFRFLAIETGLYYRNGQLGSSEVSMNEIQLPLILKFRQPLNRNFVFLIGAGISFFHQFSGSVDLDNTVGTSIGQDRISLTDQDLRSGISYIGKIEIQMFIGKRFFFSFDLGYEYSKRSLDIYSHDFTMGIGVGYAIY